MQISRSTKCMNELLKCCCVLKSDIECFWNVVVCLSQILNRASMFFFCLHMSYDNSNRSLVECLFFFYIYILCHDNTGESCTALVMIKTLVSPCSVVVVCTVPLLNSWVFFFLFTFELFNPCDVTQFIFYLIISLSMES